MMKFWIDLADRGLILSLSVLVGLLFFAGCQKKVIVQSADPANSAETTAVEGMDESDDDFSQEELEIDILTVDTPTEGATTGDDVFVSGATTGSDFPFETDATTGSSFGPDADSGTTGDEGAEPIEIEVIEEESSETASVETPNQNSFFFNV